MNNKLSMYCKRSVVILFKTLKDFNLAKSRSICILTLATLYYVFITSSSENLPL